MVATGSLSTKASPVQNSAWLLAQSRRCPPADPSRGGCEVDQKVHPAKDEWNLSQRITLLVKNTFIVCEMGEEDDRPPLRRTSSCPTLHLSPPPESAKVLQPSHNQTAVFESEASTAEEAGSTVAADTSELGSDLEDVAEHGADSKTLRLAEGVVPLGQRKPGTSAGSPLHEFKQCKPCAWYWRPQGCINGADCRHCHLCLPGAIKARRKMKVDMIREMGMKPRSRGRRPSTRGPVGNLAAMQMQAAAAPDGGC